MRTLGTILAASILGVACAPASTPQATHGPAQENHAPPPTHDLASERWTGIKARIRAEFPDVETISVGELADALEQGVEEHPPVLLDARAAEEFAISHLGGARRALTKAEALGALHDLPRDRGIVVYCSVGYRSARLAEALAGEGFTNVRNLEGSIFEWANSGHPVFCGSEPVDEVHPYDASWGELLRPDLHPGRQAAPDAR